MGHFGHCNEKGGSGLSTGYMKFQGAAESFFLKVYIILTEKNGLSILLLIILQVISKD